MADDFTRDARDGYRRPYKEGWNMAIKTTLAGIAVEYRSDPKLDKYTLDVVLAVLMGLHEESLEMTLKETYGKLWQKR